MLSTFPNQTLASQVRYLYNWEHAISDHVCKIWCKNLLMLYKRYVAQTGRDAPSSSDWHTLSKVVVIVFPNSLAVFKTHHSPETNEQKAEHLSLHNPDSSWPGLNTGKHNFCRKRVWLPLFPVHTCKGKKNRTDNFCSGTFQLLCVCFGSSWSSF